ncbi:hypothetical protein TNCV_2741291 [Trichonephila clavipes]|nr:hypothetical protein TNCV_2741291 [Trichonephila clavipes]
MELGEWIRNEFSAVTRDMMVRVWTESEYRLDICRVTKDAHVESSNEVTSTTDQHYKLTETSSRTRDNSTEGERGYRKCFQRTGRCGLKVALLG